MTVSQLWKSVRSPFLYGAYLAISIVVLLEVALRFIAPLDRDLAILLYLPGLERSYDHITSLEELMQSTVLGFVPHRLRCGFVLNSRSFRTREYAGAADHRRVVTIGDSFNFDSNGVAYEQMFSSVLERRLREQSAEPVDVFALGVPGVGPRFELRLWQLEKELLKPETVVVLFFVGNDLTDEVKLGRRQRLSEKLASHSFSFRLVRNLLKKPESIAPPAGDAQLPTGGYSVEGDDYGNLVLTREQLVAIEAQRLWITRSDQRQELNRLAVGSAEVLARFRDDVEAFGARFVVMLAPDVFQVDDSLVSESLSSLGLEAHDVDLEAPQRILISLLEEHSIDHLDLLPELRARTAEGDVLYWPHDTHWNDAGHALVGELLARHLSLESRAEDPDTQTAAGPPISH